MTFMLFDLGDFPSSSCDSEGLTDPVDLTEEDPLRASLRS